MTRRQYGTRADELRRRPKTIRYVVLAVGENEVHPVVSWGGLRYAWKVDGPIAQLFIADLYRGVVVETTDSVETFLTKWREHYNDENWDYLKEVGVVS